jgi:NTE family protein
MLNAPRRGARQSSVNDGPLNLAPDSTFGIRRARLSPACMRGAEDVTAARSAAPKQGKTAEECRTVSLALQGGGAHGAFTWGVLDRLLEDRRIIINGISATSAGAMNGAMLVYGMVDGGREGARRLLRRFWEQIGAAGQWSIFRPTPLDRLSGNHNLDHSPAYHFFDLMTRSLSPYQFNPTGLNPLRDLVESLIDFERLRASREIKLFVNTTNVRTGKIRVFKPEEMRVEALLASACLPHLFHAVEIDGEHYWDGGFMGNPAMFPLLYNCNASDIVLVEINPIRIDELPNNARAIMDRMNTISFNATMMREMRTIALVTRLLDQHRLTGSNFRRINFHMIEAEKEMQRFGASSKFNLDRDFLMLLFELGRRTAESWLDAHFSMLGVNSTIDLNGLFT